MDRDLTLVFDIETNGLLHDLTEIHCIAIHDTTGTEGTICYNDQGGAEPIVRGIQRLEDAACIIGHNIISFDCVAIKKLYSWYTNPGVCIDTLLLSRLFHPEMMALDKRKNWPNMPLQLYGRHSLESYGYRLGEYKGEYGSTSNHT